MSPILQPIDMMPARIRIAAILRKVILSGEYAQGQELSLTEIAEQVGVSRTPVREAFQMLESENLLELRMNKGAVVKGISPEVIRDHYEMRILLEGEAIHRAILHGMDTANLRVWHRQILQREQLEPEEYTNYNSAFHTEIWNAAASPKLIGFLSGLWNGSSFGKTVSAGEHQLLSLAEHGRMLELIEAREPDLARKVMEEHIRRSMNNMMDSYSHR